MRGGNQMVEDNKSIKVPGNPTGSSPSSLETKVKSSVRSAALFTGGVLVGTLAIGAAGYFIARKTQEPIYKEMTVPVQSSIVDKKEVEERVRQEYQPQLDAAKDMQAKYDTCTSDLAKEQAKPAREITSSYREIKENPDNSSKVLLNHVSLLKRSFLGELKVKGKTCPDALDSLYTMMVSYQYENDDAETRKLFIEKNKDACRVKPGDDYIIVKLE